MNVACFVVGLLVTLVTIANVLFTMVLPRRPMGIERLSLEVNRAVRLVFLGLSRLVKSYEAKDAVLAPTATVALVAQLLSWAGGLVLGFGLMLVATTHSFGSALLQALTAEFTVGAVHVGGAANLGIDITIGAIWVVIVALQIAYLPTLYGAFNRRESLVSLLESRAGVPAWGPELLARHQMVGIADTLPDLYAKWEEWSADVAESHTTYPVLLLFRSPEPWYSWVLGVLAVLDAAAMHYALDPDAASSQARLCLRMGFTLFNRIAATLGWPVDLDPNPEGPIDLTYEEFEAAVATLAELGFPMTRSAAEAWPHFRGWRVNYESVAYRIADRVTAPPAPWSGTRRHLRVETVGPRRPPQREPGSQTKLDFQRPPVTSTGRRRRR
ncbi:MAG: hypothetical protein ACRDV0_06730 [Acidimicrobiales bacterium]